MAPAADGSVLAEFLTEAGEIVERLGEQIVELERRPQDRELLNAIFRGFHTVKGGAGFLNLAPLVDLCHRAEDLFNRLRMDTRSVDAGLMDVALRAVDALAGMMRQLRRGAGPSTAEPELLAQLERAHEPRSDEISEREFDALLDRIQAQKSGAAAQAPPPDPESTVRVGTQRLDKIMDLVGELVLVRNRLKTLRARARDEDLERALGSLDQVTTTLQGAVMQARMQKVARLFGRFPKLTRDLARRLGKQVELKLAGEETDLDKNLVEALADPLLHLVRNAIDHGIELPELRRQRGKPATGTLTLSAQQEGDHILVTVREDGAGMDPETIRAKAVEKGVIRADAGARLTARECLELIFLPGFSTRQEVSEVSGRGVGMDVVKARIAELKGSVAIDSKPGQGTAICVRVPLTLAILPTLMVRLGDQVFAIPVASVLDIFHYDPERACDLDGLPVLALAEHALPLVDLRRWRDRAAPPPCAAQLVVVGQVDGERRGFVVDEVLGREEVVIKPLGAGLRGLAAYAGATVTGDGRIALILDLPGLASG